MLILVLLVLATAVKLIRYQSWSRFYYAASVCAPRTYPIYVRDTFFILPDEDTSPIATGEVNYQKSWWGESEFSSVSEKKRLPLKLVIGYASYRDRAFYQDTVDLPVDKISKLFKSSVEKGSGASMYRSSGDVKGLRFVIGVANKGNVIIWLQGENEETILLRHHITAREPRGDQTYHEGRLSKDDYLRKVFYIDEELQKKIAQGVDKDANYIDSISGFRKNVLH